MDKKVISQQRDHFIREMSGGIVVIDGFLSVQWHGDATVPFRQEANFRYLTGIDYPHWRLIIDGDAGKSWLVAPEIDDIQQLFDGSLSFDDAKQISGIDEVLDSRAGVQLLKDLARKHQTVYTLDVEKQTGFTLNPAIRQLRQELSRHFSDIKDCREVLSRLRAIKHAGEIQAIEQAASISIEAFERAKIELANCSYEHEVEAEIVYAFRRGNTQHAFDPIVASGKNACTLHYITNDSVLESSQFLLLDAGARLNGYSADITRTYALNKLSKRQISIHRAVQDAQRRIIELIQPGLTLASYLESADSIMQETLIGLGLMKSSHDKSSYRRYFPHAISHGLGLDVHESLGGYKEFQPGMVLTVEPGIYIPEEGIGVRIEDNILVTKEGHKNLTAGLSTDL